MCSFKETTMKKIATDKMQSAILRDMIGVESADMVWISGAPSQLCVIDGEYVKRENLDEYDTLAYSLDALIDVLSHERAEICFYRSADSFDHWICRWMKRIGIEVATLHKAGKTKVDAAFEVVVSLYKEGYIKRGQ